MAKEFGKWTVLEQIDEGGQGYALLVYETNDPERKPFVLKKLKNKKRLHRFKKEVKAGLDLSHPNILKSWTRISNTILLILLRSIVQEDL